MGANETAVAQHCPDSILECAINHPNQIFPKDLKIRCWEHASFFFRDRNFENILFINILYSRSWLYMSTEFTVYDRVYSDKFFDFTALYD